MTDSQLVDLYVKGQNEAFDALVERYKNLVFSQIMQTVKDAELADDIFQETFVKVIVTIKQGRYVDTGHFGSWVVRIAHNLIVDFYRRNSRVYMCSTDDEEQGILNQRTVCDENIESEIEVEEIKNDLYALIRMLPISQRKVLVMRFYHNMTFREIADHTRVSINTALGRLRYALINLRRLAAEHNVALA